MSLVDITTQVRVKQLIMLSVIILFMFSSFRQEVKFIPSVFKIHDTVLVADSVLDIKLTEKEILKELIKQGCVLPNVAFAQMKIETGNFKSAICRENKNIAGIKTSKSKHVVGMNRGHCSYKTYKDCIKDYVRIQNRYLKNIDGRYAENPQYVQKLKSLQ
jgi:uncharacterized FlgJ-related protein